MKTRIRVISNVVGIIFCLVSFFLIFAIDSKAEIVDIDISGKGYVFEDSDDYEYEGVIPTYSIENGENAIGKFYISGSELSKGEYIDGVESYGSDYGVVSFIYDYDILKTNLSEKLWHITKDTGNDVGDIELEDDIGKGVIIIQASMDGKKWITESVVSDFFSEEKDPLIYETSDIQLINGCFFRILIAYRQEITVDASIFGVSTTKDANRKMMELYKFYLYSTDDKSNVISAGDSPRKELGTKVNAGKDTGYSEMNTIELDDPHYGWDIGTFCVNGYTREEKNDTGTPVFLKNLGDRVTLWFSLKQDIECLNGNEKLSIEEDSDGYDLLYEIAKTNFGHGTLIIQYTDYEGKKSDPIVYTDYLLANARTGADTKVTLFEEGDYDVALDYSIKDESGVFPKYTNYKISFSFAVRNSNCMVFP